MRAFYDATDSNTADIQKSMAALGFTAEDFGLDDDFDECDVWPCNHVVWLTFTRVSTQWRVGGMGGATGLDYTALYPLLDRLPPDDWDEVFDGVRCCEIESLAVFAEKMDSKK